MTAHRLLPVITLFAVALHSSRSWAEPNVHSATSDRVTAQVLFERGRALFVDGNFEKACPLLEESHRLAPAIGVLLHLGACLEKSNRVAGAWAAFAEAADRARAENDSEREGLARSRAQQLQTRLAYVTLRLQTTDAASDPASMVPADLEIQCDGQTIPAASIGIEMPLDPSAHSIRIRARGMQDVLREINLRSGEHSTLIVELQPLSSSVSALQSKSQGPRSEAVATVARVEVASGKIVPMRSNRWAWVPWTAAGVGAASLLTGVAAGLLAHEKMQDARMVCREYANNDCPPESIRLQEQARTRANVATVSLIAGAASLTFAAGYWLISHPGRTVVTGSVGPAAGFVAVQSRW